LHTATAKAREVAESHSGAVILAANTIVIVDGDVLGKPGDRAEVPAMLSRLAGREYQVLIGCCLIAPWHEECFAVRTRGCVKP